jgi:hypothetical protein
MNKGVIMRDGMHPPFSRVGEVVAEDDNFICACEDMLSGLEVKHGWIVGGRVLTKNSEWGIVYRASFRSSSEAVGGLGSIVFWKTSDDRIAVAVKSAD